MIDQGIPGYLQEIPDTYWVQETISETFDGILELMTPYSVVYGGAIRDCFAGLDLVGDLDIAVSQQEFSNLSARVQTSPKWLPEDCGNFAPNARAEEVVGEDPPLVFAKWSDHKAHKSSPYDTTSKFSTIAGVTDFVNATGSKVQLITSKQHTKNPFQDAVYMARMVDIVCCALIMTSDGRVFEVVPGAHQDCRDRILRLNKNSTAISIETLPTRVEKFKRRGWENTIDVEKAMRAIKRRQVAERRRHNRQLMSQRRKKTEIPGIYEDKLPMSRSISVLNILGDPEHESEFPIHGGETYTMDSDEVQKNFGDDIDLLSHVVEMAARDAGVNITAKIAPVGTIHFTARDYPKLVTFSTKLRGIMQYRKKRGQNNPSPETVYGKKKPAIRKFEMPKKGALKEFLMDLPTISEMMVHVNTKPKDQYVRAGYGATREPEAPILSQLPDRPQKQAWRRFLNPDPTKLKKSY